MLVKQLIRKYWYLLGIGMGVLSGFVVTPYDWTILPGIIFGIFSAIYFIFSGYLDLTINNLFKLFFWVLASCLSYATAIISGGLFDRYLHLDFFNAGGTSDIGIMGIMGVAGLVGVSILIITFHFLFLRLNIFLAFIFLLLGALIPIIIVIFKGNNFLYVSIFWQTMVMLILGYRINLEKRNQS